MLCVNATCSVSNYHICELCIAILLQDIIYVNYTMLSCCKGIIYVNYAMPWCLANHHVCELYHAIFFCIMCSICRQRLYIQLLFLCISHLKQWWKYLEWKQGIQSRQCYLLKQTSCWLQRAPQRRIQRLMTSPISPWGLCSNLAGLYYSCHACCLAFLSFYIIYGLPSAYLLTI